MRNVARLSLSRLAPVFWAGAAVLVVLVITHPEWGLMGGRVAISALVLLTGAAIGGSVCRSIEKTHDDCVDTMLAALVRTRPSPATQLRNRRPAA